MPAVTLQNSTIQTSQNARVRTAWPTVRPSATCGAAPCTAALSPGVLAGTRTIHAPKAISAK